MLPLIVLIKPPSPTLNEGKISKLPLELLTLASSVLDRAFATKIESRYGVQLPNHRYEDLIIRDFSNAKYDEIVCFIGSLSRRAVFGITATTPQYPLARKIAQEIKHSNPQNQIVIGGAHATLAYENVVNDSVFDVVNQGEGVESFPLILADLINPSMLNRECIHRKRMQAGRKNQIIPQISMDEYPYPSNMLDKITLENYDCTGFLAHQGRIKTPIALIINSNGCRSRCSFCAVGEIYPYYIERKVHHIVEEIKNYIRVGVRLFHIADDNFSEDPSKPINLAALLTKLVGRTSIEWVYNIKVSTPTVSFILNYGADRYFSELRAGGCCGISIGVETGDQALLSELSKGINLESVHYVTNLARKNGLGVKWYLMVGLPGENRKSIELTVNLFEKSLPTGIAVSFFTPHIGTHYYNDMRIQFITDDLGDRIACPEPKDRYTDKLRSPTQTDTLSADEITAARNEILYNFKQLRLQDG